MKIKYFLLICLFSTLSFNLIIAQSKTTKKTEEKPRVIFIELGSVNCIPCRMMQPVMKNIELKYGKQIKVIFYDVWTQEQRK
ncbi:thioredoxin family protein [Rosettibacter firmus]|uniref:thioredoxin family protein n=1 Tax=Rosettibacter firmus TaxID=3111522 RepID=UPI00336BB0EC